MTGKLDSTPGADPIAGALEGDERIISGLDPNNPDHDITMMTGRFFLSLHNQPTVIYLRSLDFVVSRGGEYFFSPPLSALLDPIGA